MMSKLDTKREFLLLQIVELKRANRLRKLLLAQKDKYLNRMANDITISNEEKLDTFAYKLNKMFKNE